MSRGSRIVVRTFAAAAIVLVALGAPWASKSQISGSSTGWCTDYAGNNFPCSDAPSSSGGSSGGGGGGYGYGYGGCATASNAWGNQPSDDAINRENASNMISMGNIYYDDGDYISAADIYYNAWQTDPSNRVAKRNMGNALSYLGSEALDRGHDMSALLYHERAVDARPDDDIIYDYYEEAAFYAPSKNCSTCGKAIMNDIAYGLGASASIYTYVHQATVNYDNCTRRLSCNDTDGSSFRYLARESCYQTYLHSESGFRACLTQALEDRGYTFW